jgi:hypothetical protein
MATRRAHAGWDGTLKEGKALEGTQITIETRISGQ